MRRMRRALAGGESGQALVLAVVLMPLFLAVVGLAIDGGVVFERRRELQNAADAAARAGAMQVDLRAYRESAGQTVVLDPDGARQVAADYLAAQGGGLDGAVRADTQRVFVELSREVPTSFLRIVGISTVRVGATAPAELRYGVERGNG